jgi:hypothetical protein
MVLVLIKYSRKIYLKENTFPNSITLFFTGLKIAVSEKRSQIPEIKQNITYINSNVQYLHLYKCFPFHILMEPWSRNLPLYDKLKNRVNTTVEFSRRFFVFWLSTHDTTNTILRLEGLRMASLVLISNKLWNKVRWNFRWSILLSQDNRMMSHTSIIHRWHIYSVTEH